MSVLPVSSIYSEFDTKEALLFAEYILIISNPIVCFIGIMLNIIVVYVVFRKSVQSNLQATHYTYMGFYSLVNSLILLLQLFTIISECQYRGVFCSTIRQSQVVNTTKLYSANMWATVFEWCRMWVTWQCLFTACRWWAKTKIALSCMCLRWASKSTWPS